MGRQVRKGEHGIGVLARITHRPSRDTTDGIEDDQDQDSTPGPPAPRVRGWKIECVLPDPLSRPTARPSPTSDPVGPSVAAATPAADAEGAWVARGEAVGR